MPEEVQLPLASAIRSLRAEIVTAVRAGAGEEIQFALGPVELELQIEATLEAGVEGGFKFWLASAGASTSRTSGRTHTVRLTLTPVRAGAAGERSDVLVATDLEARD
jgi:hypothetical protein